jgi:hypothetical protein
MLIGKAVHALQLDDKLLADHEIGHILAEVLLFVTDRE